MLIDLLKTAVENRQLLAFTYDGLPRLVEPHAVGTNRKGQMVMRAWQLAGESATVVAGWKLFTLEKATNLQLVALPSSAPRSGYKTGDKAMLAILAELPEPTPVNLENAA